MEDWIIDTRVCLLSKVTALSIKILKKSTLRVYMLKKGRKGFHFFIVQEIVKDV